MLRFMINRAGQSAILLLIVTLITFFLVNLAPGGPASTMRMEATEEERQAIVEKLGLDQPVHIRYVEWLKNALQGDLGTSFTSSEPVIQRIMERLPYTIELTIFTIVISVILGIFFGVISTVKRGKAGDHVINFVSVIGLSVPAFWLGLMLILLFSITFKWLPSSGVGPRGAEFELWGWISHLIMPVLILTTTVLPHIVRFTRSSMLEVTSQNYIRTARAKGAKESVVLYVHALRNALIPIITIIGMLIPRLLSGAVITEAIFGWTGIGTLIIDAARGRDYPLVMGITVMITIVVVFCNLIVDFLYSRVDPRVKNV
ncbi:peptide/nickel transport system permease protein [Cytobacillus firmus]|uniref:Peptide/nickel transport system permease protein n=2 Tax=Cytobacillus TaxID=2675230 RepID=A0A366JHE3_CYTFI|nr:MULTISPECIES: ABC transporter permease [Cytobacillus]RBP85900.1 peptide/nickel transport system permease protein [Cytobacillus firmus]TDX35102.1 peptide/nickel transport system permease protein [Cytobacillus oceanisediminis]